jgi:hypothetical protein
MTVHFRNVGRDKKQWSASVESLSDGTLVAQIRANKALMSKGIDFVWNNERTGGAIYVGMFRKVGDFWIEGGWNAR